MIFDFLWLLATDYWLLENPMTRPMSEIRKRMLAGVEAGDCFTVRRTFIEDDMHLFTGVSHDHNPIHFNEGYAEGKGFTGLICHGLHVGSLVTEIGGELGMLASGMNFHFRRPVYCGDTITCTLTIDEMDERNRVKCTALFTNQHGEDVIEGQLFGILPSEEEKKLLTEKCV
ncbi:MAG: MaoC family dehydratase [bacterium]|nr:MaoC family dehydratase [bacterium]